MLRLQKVKHLATRLDVSIAELERLIGGLGGFCHEYRVHDPEHPEKRREVISIVGRWRTAQERVLKRLLQPCLVPSIHSHGGIPARHVKTNAQVHAGSNYAFRADISDFFRSITHTRVYRFFTDQMRCSPEVARILTKLTTFRHHLALGLVTSPIIADQIMVPIDRRIAMMCSRYGLVYSRYVDDIAISGSFDLSTDKCGLAALTRRILSGTGFLLHPRKSEFGKLDEGFSITKIRQHHGHLDIEKEFADKINAQIEVSRAILRGEAGAGLYYTESQIRGRIQFAMWVNPGRRFDLWRSFRSVDWNALHVRARSLGLIQATKVLVRIDPQSRMPVTADENAPPVQAQLNGGRGGGAGFFGSIGPECIPPVDLP